MTHNLQFGVYVVNAHKNEIPQPSYGMNGFLQFTLRAQFHGECVC